MLQLPPSLISGAATPAPLKASSRLFFSSSTAWSLNFASPLPLSPLSNGRSVSRALTLSVFIAAHSFGPFSNPAWNANVRSNAVPCAPRSAALVPAWSRIRNIDAITWFRPSDVDTW